METVSESVSPFSPSHPLPPPVMSAALLRDSLLRSGLIKTHPFVVHWVQLLQPLLSSGFPSTYPSCTWQKDLEAWARDRESESREPVAISTADLTDVSILFLKTQSIGVSSSR